MAGAGDDTLTGHRGNDHLEGGAGQDTALRAITPGDGFDTVLDSDGSGAVVIGGIQANGKAAVIAQADWLLSTNTWQDRENGLNYQLIAQADGTQDLYLIGSHGSTRIRNWHGGDLGISLGMGGIAAIPGYGLTLTGDLAPIDQDAGAPGIQLGYDALDNVLIGATPEPGRADVLYDSAGDDLIQGLGGNDILYAWRGGADRLEGGDGDDILDAGPGADLATGNAGQDLVWGLAGADVLYGGDEQALDAALLAGETQVGSGQKGDLLGGGDDNDSLIGDAGNDALAGGAGGDLLIGGGGDDNLMGDEDLTNANLGWSLTRNVISDANGNTQYQRLYNNVDAAEAANGGADILYGGAGNDWLLGQMGDDILDGGSGDDVLFGGAGGDVMLGQAGDDLLIGDDASAPADQQGDGYLDGGAGDDTLKGGIGADQLIGGAGDDTLFAFDGDDHLDGGAGQDWLIGDDLSVAGAQHGADTLDGGDDDDYLFGQGGGDRLQGGQGNDYLQGDDGALAGEYHGNDSLDGGAGSDTLLGDGGHDTLDGGDGDDSLFGDNHPSQPLAEEFQGNDILNGGAGLDYLEGGAGDDVYRFKAGDSPLIGGTAESVNDSKGHDRIEFGAGVGAGNILLYQYGQDMALQYGGNDWLWIYGGFNGAVESFGFDNGAKMSWMQLIGLAYGSVVNSSTGSANATLSGGNQNDSLTATGGGSSFSGGKGDDTLAGAGGGNTYLYNLGDGSDTIQDTGGQTDAQGNSVPNVLSFGEGITADDISLELGSLLIRVGSDPNDTIRIANFNPNDVLGQRAIDRFAFADGTVLSYEDLLARGFDLAGTAGNDTITGTNIQDRISGGAGNDTLSGGAGDDRLAGASGNDILSGGAGSDTYEFNLGDGVDTLSEVAASADTDVLVFGSGINPSDISAVRNGDDLELRHANGGDKVVVANWFSGSTGFYQLDRVEFADGTQWLATNISQMLANSPPTGSVTLSGTAAQGQVLTAGNTLADADGLGSIGYQWQTSADGTTWGNLAGATGASFTLAEAQVGEQVRVVASYTDGQGRAEAVASAASAAVANVNDAPTAATPLANQAATQGQDFSFTLPVHAFIDPDQVHGDALSHAATQADGSALPAWLSFNSATKTFSGTPANGDVGELSLKVTATDLGGLAAAQTFGLAVANINDAPSLSAPLADQLAHAGSAFTFQLPANTFADIDMGDVLAYHATRADGTALPAWLTFDPTTRTFKGTPGASDVGQFDARVVATDAGGLTAFDVFALAIDQDAMTGTPDDDNLVGAAGDDTLSGGAGNDVLDGGAGADLLLAGAGDDGFLMSALDGTWAKGYGVLNDGSPGHAGSGQVIAIAGRKANHDVMDGGDGWDTLTGTGFDDVIVLDDRFSPTALSGPRFMNIEQFAGGGGNDIIDLTSQIYVYGDVILDGGEGKDVLWAGSGNDRLIGGAGNDLLDGGYGADTMIGGSGNDTYTVDNPGDVVTENAGQGTDTVKSSVSHTLGDNVEKLVLTGGTATNGTGNPLNNILTGNGGANTLDGGAGNDILQGGKGNDTYLFNRGGGVDTWIENDAAVGNVDVGRFGLDILHDQIWFLRKGNNLEMSAIGTSDKAVLKDWYLSGARHLERFEAGDGRVLLDSQVDVLVQAMAAFAPPAAGQTSLPANYHDALAPVLAANWQ
ncbi:MAG: putative Ig domain-containing protein [Hydrogenophilales bacterium]|nr:putative Ig domain-containing protein [Hydrogenophilales bacterium]